MKSLHDKNKLWPDCALMCVCVCVFEWAGGTKELHNLFDLIREEKPHARHCAYSGTSLKWGYCMCHLGDKKIDRIY